jgi:hypothetical protein
VSRTIPSFPVRVPRVIDCWVRLRMGLAILFFPEKARDLVDFRFRKCVILRLVGAYFSLTFPFSFQVSIL